MFELLAETLTKSGPYTGPAAMILLVWLFLERKERIAAQAARLELLEQNAAALKGLADAAVENYARQGEALDRLERAVRQ